MKSLNMPARRVAVLHIVLSFLTVPVLMPSAAMGDTPLSKQSRDGEPAQQMMANEFAELGDPFFLLVLKDRPQITRLSEIEARLQPNAEKRRIFVVDEHIVDPRPGQSRRSVLTYSGQGPDGTVLDTNVMLSVFFDSEEFPDSPDSIESWGWDAHRGRYNYYKLDNSGTPTMQMTWKFRGSSVGVDQLSQNDRRGTCFRCHVNGGPVMKELLFPWNNWHSDVSKSPANYLKAGNPGAWAVASTDRFHSTANSGLSDASNLEISIIAANHQFNRRRINAALKRRESDGNIELRSDGTQIVLEGRRLLRPLFFTTEYNIGSAKRKSGLHALPTLDQTGPGGEVVIPNSFFLNAELIAGGGQAPGFGGLGVKEAKEFGDFAKLAPNDYKKLVQDSNVFLHGRPSDANFAWFTPEPSFIDNDLVDQLLKRGIASPAFVAATLAIDLENPVQSKKRSALLNFVPNDYAFKPIEENQNPLEVAPHPDQLTRSVIEALTTTHPKAGSAEAEWLALLKDPQPIQRLRELVIAYRDRVKQRMANDPAEARRLFDLLIKRRKAVNADPVLRNLDETGGRSLLPVPPN